MADTVNGAPLARLDLDDLLDTARRAALAGAGVALDWRSRAGSLRVEEKAGPADLVSQADREAEEAIRAVLAECRPDDSVLGEEAGVDPGRSGVRWLVDPIDGTTNYLYGRETWSVSVAACTTSGRQLLTGVVLEPMLHRVTEARVGGGTLDGDSPAHVLKQSELNRALVEINLGRPDQRPQAAAMVGALVPRVRDLRRGGSAAAALARVATGRADAAWLPGLQPWDFAAGVLLVQEAGGVVGDLDGPTEGTWPDSGDILAAPEELFEPLRALLSAAYRGVT